MPRVGVRRDGCRGGDLATRVGSGRGGDAHGGAELLRHPVGGDRGGAVARPARANPLFGGRGLRDSERQHRPQPHHAAAGAGRCLRGGPGQPGRRGGRGGAGGPGRRRGGNRGGALHRSSERPGPLRRGRGAGSGQGHAGGGPQVRSDDGWGHHRRLAHLFDGGRRRRLRRPVPPPGGAPGGVDSRAARHSGGGGRGRALGG